MIVVAIHSVILIYYISITENSFYSFNEVIFDCLLKYHVCFVC